MIRIEIPFHTGTMVNMFGLPGVHGPDQSNASLVISSFELFVHEKTSVLYDPVTQAACFNLQVADTLFER